MLKAMGDPKHKRRWYQFSLRSLLIFVGLCALPCSWYAVRMRTAEKQRVAVEKLRKAGAKIHYDYQGSVEFDIPDREPSKFLQNIFGIDFLSNVTGVICDQNVNPSKLNALKDLPRLRGLDLLLSQYADADIAFLDELPDLKWIGVPESMGDEGLRHLAAMHNLEDLCLHYRPITDQGLIHLQGLKHLESLDLTATKITDKGLQYLGKLKNLKNLRLEKVHITDAGLAYLSNLENLEDLLLEFEEVGDDDLIPKGRITDVGLEHIGRLTNLKELFLDGHAIHGEGLVHLGRLKNLEQLRLNNTKVTDDTLAYLAEIHSLKDLWINKTPITDAGMKHLVCLTNLKRLIVNDTKVTAKGASIIQAALPKCEVEYGPILGPGGLLDTNK
jgi:internalin A